MRSSLLFLFLFALFAVPVASSVYAQSTPPPALESKNATPPAADPISIGKITIQTSQTEQIVIDLPLRDGGKYQVIPIK